MGFDLFSFSQQPGIGAEHLDESLNFCLCGFSKLDKIVSLLGRKEIEGLNAVERSVHTVDPAYSLHKLCWIPWNVIIDDRVGAVQIHTFGQHVGRYHNAVIILPLKSLRVKVVQDRLPDTPI